MAPDIKSTIGMSDYHNMTAHHGSESQPLVRIKGLNAQPTVGRTKIPCIRNCWFPFFGE